MKEFLLELFCISLPTTVVILLLSALSGGIKKTFSATCRYIIWLVVIIRLAIPLGGQLLPSLIEIPIYENVYGTGEDEEVKAPAPSAPITDNSRPTPDTTPSSPIPEGSDGSSYAPDAITPETGAAPESPILDKGEPEEEKTLEFEPSLLVPLLFFIWAGGAVAFVLSDVIGYSVFMARIKKALVPADDRTKALYEELCSKLNVKSPPPLYISAESSSPMLCGYIKKRIILPDMPLSDEAKAMVLAHELCHYRRGDLWAKLLARIANAIHWFNPAAYLASSHFNREMELSCDDRVISALSDEERLTYGQTMLDIVRNCRGGGTALTTKFNPKKKAAGERISNIVDWKKKKRGIVIICIVAALCIVAGVIIGIKTVSDNDPDGDTDDFTVSLYHVIDSYRICGKEGIKDKGPLKLLIDEETEIYFEGLYGAVYSSSHDDYNGDGIKDHCFSATVNSDNGCKSELYIFDGKTLEMLPYTPAKDVSVENNVKLYGNDEFYCIEIGDEVTGVSKSKLSDIADSLPDAPIARLYGFDIRAGAPVLKFNVIIIPKNGSASDEKSIGALIVPYEYDGKMLSAKESGVKFEKDSFSHGIFEEYATVITKGESFTLYATNEKAKSGGENEPLKLALKDTSILFEGSYTSAVGTETEYYNVDVTGDSVSDHIIILPGSDDDEASKKEIHVFDGNTLREKKFDDSYEYVSDHVTLSSDEHTYFVKTDDSSLVREYSCYKRLFASFGTENHSDNVLIDSSCSGFVVDENSIRVKHNIHLENNKNEIIGIVSAHCNFSKEENKFICNSFSFYFTGIKNDRYNEWYARQDSDKIYVVNLDTRYVYSASSSYGYFNLPDMDTEKGFRMNFIAGDLLSLEYTVKQKSEKDPVTQRSAIISTTDGRILHVFEMTAEEILACSDLSADVLAPYRADGKNDYTITISPSSGIHTATEINYAVELAGADERVRLYRSLYLNIYDKSIRVDNIRDHINPTKEITSIDDLDQFIADDDVKDMLRAFLTNDTEALEKCMNQKEGVFAPYKDLRFGNYKITDDAYGNKLYLDVEITESSLDTIPPGEYELTFSVVYGGLGIDGLREPQDPAIKRSTKATEFVRKWQNSACEFSFDKVHATENLAQKHGYIVYFLSWYRGLGQNTPERYKEEAKKIFGMDDLDVSDYLQKDGTVFGGGRGGPTFFYTVESETVKDGIITLRIQTYTDYMYTIKSDLYEYKFEDMGDYLRAISCELVEKGKYEYRGISV